MELPSSAMDDPSPFIPPSQYEVSRNHVLNLFENASVGIENIQFFQIRRSWDNVRFKMVMFALVFGVDIGCEL